MVMHNSRLFLLMLSVVLLCAIKVSAQGPPETAGATAPEFVRKDLSGHSVNLEKYRGKVVLLNFWATWCAPCQVELPEFGAWEKKYGTDSLQVIAVSMDDGDSTVRKTVRRLHLDFPVVMGDAEIGQAYGGVLGLPVTFLIDRDGKIAAHHKGETDLGQMEAEIQRLLSR